MTERWTQEDFDQLGWHDCRMYSLSLPNDVSEVCFEIDYILEWIKEGNHYTKYLVAPCRLTFSSVRDFTVEIKQKNQLCAFISQISRSVDSKNEHGEINRWHYIIELDVGTLSFSSSEFVQVLLAEPILSKTQDLNRSV